MQEILDKKLLFVSGKGGTGKTFIAAALAFYASKQGKKVLLMEQSKLENLPSMFGYNSNVGHHETQVYGGIHCINLDPSMCFQEYVVKHLGMSAIYERVFTNKMVKSFLAAIPGLGETMMLGRMFHSVELTDIKKYDLLIFDGPASGHFLHLMNTPQLIINSDLAGPLVREVERVKKFISQPEKCATVFVASPEELIVGETLDILPKLRALSILKQCYLFINHSLSHLEKDLTQLVSLLSVHPHLAYAVRYAQEKMKSSLHWEQELITNVLEQELCEKILLFPELGVISEPIPKALSVAHSLRSFRTEILS